MSENDRILIGRYKTPYMVKRGYRELLERELTAWNQKSYKTIGSVINSCMTQKLTYLSPPAPDVFESGGQFYERVVVVTSSVPYRDIEVLAPRGRVIEYVNIVTPPPPGMKYIKTYVTRNESLHEVYARGALFDTSNSFQFGVCKCFHPVPMETTSCAFVVMTEPHWDGTGHERPDFSIDTVAISFPEELRGNDDALLEFVKPKFVELATAAGYTVPEFFEYGARVSDEKYVTFVAVVKRQIYHIPAGRTYLRVDQFTDPYSWELNKYHTRYSLDINFRMFALGSESYALWTNVELGLDDEDVINMDVFARRRNDSTLFDYETTVLTRADFSPYESAYDVHNFELHMRRCRSELPRGIPPYRVEINGMSSLSPEVYMKYYLDNVDAEDTMCPVPFISCPSTTRDFNVMAAALKIVNDTPALYEFQRQTVRRVIRQEFSGDGILGSLSNRITGDVGGTGFFAVTTFRHGIELRIYKRMTDYGRALLCHRGGMIFDDPGMGKTRQAIYLVKATMMAERAIPPQGRYNARTGATLIIVKPNVLKQWESEIKTVWPDCRIAVWHGARKKKIVHSSMRSDYDIVLTTTSIVSKSNDDDPIRAAWCRVIIDEAHDMSWALAGLHTLSDRRWVMTGTPHGNGIVRMLKFTVGRAVMGLGYEPSDNMFRMFVVSRLATRKTLARHVELPHVDITNVSVNMSRDERELHDAIVTRVENPNAYTNVALLQIYNAVTNAINFGTTDRSLANPSIPSPTRWIAPSHQHEMVVDNELIIPDDAMCPVCLDTPDDPCVTTCNHWFCAECISMSISRNPICPLCRTTISVSTTRKRGRDESDDATEPGESIEPVESVEPTGYVGTKATEMLTYIENALETSNRSVIVFFTTPTAVDTFATQCTDRGIESKRIHGRISLVQRHDAFDAFQRGETRLLIATIRTMADGITLTRASDILIATPTGSNALDHQIIGRANRIGRDVTVPLRVTRFTYADSLEARYLDEQLHSHTGRANRTLASIFT
jgi:hypothetical protein